MSENVYFLLPFIYHFETLSIIWQGAISHSYPAHGVVYLAHNSTCQMFAEIKFNQPPMNHSIRPYAVRQEKIASLLHVCLECSPQQRVKGLVLLQYI